MEISVIDFVKSSILGIGFALLFLVLGMLFLSEKMVWTITKILKPNIKKNINKIFLLVTNILVNNKYAYQGKDEEERMKRMKKIDEGKDELKKIENNIFILDSLIGMFEMIRYIIRSGFSGDQIYTTVLEYFQCYCTSINQIGDKDLRNEIYEEFGKFNSEVIELMPKSREERKNEDDEIYWERMKKVDVVAQKFYDFLDNVKEELKNQLEEKKKDVIVNVDTFLEEI